ncbi:MAG: ATP-dependent RNA helicase HrpA [Cellvibrionales bacterium]|nr:ATP-dependent RNA helicase HrpA [Cellvibrionales bacterium]
MNPIIELAITELPTAEQLPACHKTIEKLLGDVLIRDQYALRQRFQKIKVRADKGLPFTQDAQRFLDKITASLKTVALRKSSFPSIQYPEALPVAACRDQIAEAIQQHQVVIIAGETGSGKTTQIPKICAELGRGVTGRIGHTQPRRLAARTVAARIADELEVPLGSAVGFHFRFNDQYDDSTRIKVMTDGILLAAIANDRYLRDYDTLIIDEAHERSLNIDFLLGYLKTLLPKRPDLKLIVTSATIDVDRFAQHFSGAPVIEIAGRSFPVEIEYLNELSEFNGDADDDTSNKTSNKSLNDNTSNENASNDRMDSAADVNARVRNALAQIDQNDSTSKRGGPRDVLVFLPGEREIRDLSQFLKRDESQFEILPLYARLSQKEQQRIFTVNRQSSLRRRVILATNVAETSVTVPGIGYVIDSGIARISRYSARSKLQRLPLEAISQASANQRAGRCGRLAPGVCYRLYTEDDFKSRPEFTEPELLRTNLAAVVLQMKGLDIGDITQFPFMEQPDGRQIRSGLKTLEELGALNEQGKLTAIGRDLAGLPVDPRLGRMLLASLKQQNLDDVLIIVSALAVQDPREMPADKRQAADQAHRRFWHKRSDFLAWINLWHYYEAHRIELSENHLRKLCKKSYLSYPRMREWRDLHRQLLLAVKPLLKNKRHSKADSQNQNTEKAVVKPDREWLTNEKGESVDDLHQFIFTATDIEKIHCALLTGLPSNVGLKEKKGEYRGARNLKFFLFPASSQFKPAPQWVMSAEIVETRKVYARSIAAIDPLWVIAAVPHLVKHEYNEPHWDAKRGQVMAFRSSSLYGLTLASRQLIAFEQIDREAARSVFIQQALAAGHLQANEKLRKRALFWQHNIDLIAEITLLEEKVRRRDLLVDEVALAAFYQRHLPDNVLSRRGLEQWLKKATSEEQKKLFLTRSDVLLTADGDDVVEQFPDSIEVAGQSFLLRYCFKPGDEQDGVTAIIPLGALGGLPVYPFDWLVPGMLRDKCIDMIKALPKAQRKRLVPVPSVVDSLLPKLNVERSQAANQSLAQALAEQIAIYYSLPINPVLWREQCETGLDNYCRMRFEIDDKNGVTLHSGRVLSDLISQCRQQLDVSINEYASGAFRQDSLTQWDFGTLKESHDYEQDGVRLRGYPALIDSVDSVSLDLLATPAEAISASREGIIRLMMLATKDKVRYLKKSTCKNALAILPFVHCGNRDVLVDDVIKTAFAASCLHDFAGPLPATKEAFDDAIKQGAGKLLMTALQVEDLLYESLKYYQQIIEQLAKRRPHFAQQCADIDAQLERLIYTGFLQRMGLQRLKHLPRYLNAILLRLDRLSGSAAKDIELCEKLSSVEKPLKTLLYNYPEAIFSDPAVMDFRWLLEELRVSLFAQQLKTPIPVSLQRVTKEWTTINHNQYPMLS